MELKKCPFCGGKAVFNLLSEGVTNRYGIACATYTGEVECTACGAKIKKTWGETNSQYVVPVDSETPVEAWNRRVSI